MTVSSLSCLGVMRLPFPVVLGLNTGGLPSKSMNSSVFAKDRNLNRSFFEDLRASRKSGNASVWSNRFQRVIFDLELLLITFRDLSYTVPAASVAPSKGNGPEEENLDVTNEKVILNGISGCFEPGKLTAVMGMSGAGKTSLLNIIAGKTRAGRVEGEVLVNGADYTGERMKDISGFVYQDDLMFGFMTVKDSIEMSARLRLPESVTKEEKEIRILDTIDTLNLIKCEKTKVGDCLKKGLSGGEIKRTAIGMELIANPPILFLDEPTTGLDSYTSYAVVKRLSLLAKQGRTVIATIHQPNSETFALFDDLCLMKDGEIIYFGPAKRAVTYFSRLGFKCPAFANPADFIFLEVIGKSVNPQSLTAASVDLIQAWRSSREYRSLIAKIESVPELGVATSVLRHRASTSAQFSFLIERSLKNMYRELKLVGTQLFFGIYFGVLIGLAYINGARPSKTLTQQIRNQAGALYFTAQIMHYWGIFSTITIFSKEAPIVYREYTSGYYNISPYFFAKISVIVPFIICAPFMAIIIYYYMIGFDPAFSTLLMTGVLQTGACFGGAGLGTFLGLSTDNTPVVMAIQPLITLVLTLFSGLYTSELPGWLVWIRFISPIYYAFSGSMKLQFDGPITNCPYPELEICNGSEVLEFYNLDDGLSVGVDLVLCVALGTFWFTLAYVTFVTRSWYKNRKQ